METISSTQNPKIKEVLTIQEKSSYRKKKGVFIIEGQKEIKQAISSSIEIITLFCKDIDILENITNSAEEFIYNSIHKNTFLVTDNVYSRMAYRDSTEGAIAIAKNPNKSLSDLSLSENPLIIILESVEKPGNLGAVVRTADAVGADAVIVCEPTTDIYNPNVIRSSVGGIFSKQVIASSSEETYKWLVKNNIKILTAQLQNSELYYDTNMKDPIAIVMGTESTGLSNYWREKANRCIRIPMLGDMDSLNVSVSAAILCYEAIRQRQ